MKTEKIDFNVALKDSFGEVVKEKKQSGDKEGAPVMIDVSIVNIISHPAALSEEATLTSMQIVERLALQQKLAARVPAVYTTDELAIIRDAVLTLFNKKMLSLELAGAILKITE